MSSIALSINLNKIALLRNSRDTNFPDPLDFAQICIDGGCQGITVHPRPDMRHIRPDDVRRLASLTDQYPAVEYNIEGNPFAGAQGQYPGFVELVLESKPDQVTLVPDTDDQLTSDHGFDMHKSKDSLAPLIAKFKEADIRVSLFMDPDPKQISAVKEVGADRIELYTGPYAEAYEAKDPDFLSLHERFKQAAVYAQSIGLGVNAGHDLNLENLQKFTEIPGVLEVSIGHAFTVDSMLLGIQDAIAAYLDALKGESGENA